MLTSGNASSPAITALAAAEQKVASIVLARAFRDNPLNVAVIGERSAARRLRSNLHGMRSLLPVAEAHGDVLVARLEGRVVGTLISAPPGAYPLPPPDAMSRLRCIAGQGIRVALRWGHVFETLRAHHPREPSWYLGTLGVDPEFQGRGVGSALLAQWLERVDRDHCSAYLETDVPENLRFYTRVGFGVEGELPVLGIPIWRMRRAPRIAAFSAATDPH